MKFGTKLSALPDNRIAGPYPPASAGKVRFERERGVTEVSATQGVGHVTALMAEDVAAERLELLQQIAAANIPVFLVKLLPSGISFALRKEQVNDAEALLEKSKQPYVLRRDLAMISIIAGAMRDLSGVMAIIYEALVGEGIRVQQTSDAYNAVHCLVPGEDAERAAKALRHRFDLPTELETPPQPEGVGLKSL